jgi:hypothetical protein
MDINIIRLYLIMKKYNLNIKQTIEFILDKE